MATVDDKKVIFSMVGVSKTIQPNQKQVLKNIYLSFFYGAKIGIIGLNGAGKSTLMKIIAGLDQQYQGNVVWSPGYSVGYLPQDPPLNEEKTVKENVMEGVQAAPGRAAGHHRRYRCMEYGLQAGSCDGCAELSSRRLVGQDTLGWRAPSCGTVPPPVAEA